MKFFISDTHFGHNKHFIYKDRGFGCIEEHDQFFIDTWNEAVGDKDEVYHIGDFSCSKLERTIEILEQLNGIKYLVRGNHDKPKHIKRYEHYFEWVKDYYELKCNNAMFVLCHYPFDSWNKSHYGSYHFHGHIHNNVCSRFRENRLNVGVDIWKRPVSIDELIKECKSGSGLCVIC